METHTYSPLIEDANAVLLRIIPRDSLSRSLSKYFDKAAPDGVVSGDYEMWRCTQTGLEFARPMVPGSTAFYNWIASVPGYYPANRWEYQWVADRLAGRAVRPKVADVGCGDGKFLRWLLDQRDAAVLGIDTLESSVEKCRAKGVEAHCGLIGDLLQADPSLHHAFDCVTSFHCLEHVPDPLGFMRELCSLLKPGGLLCVSTPLSPMPFESVWFDPQNHPPHHMTRWNVAAYRRMAELLAMDAEFHFSKPSGLVRSLYWSWRLRILGGPFVRPGIRHWRQIAWETFRLPYTAWQFARGWRRSDSPGSDGVLVCLRSKARS